MVKSITPNISQLAPAPPWIYEKYEVNEYNNRCTFDQNWDGKPANIDPIISGCPWITHTKNDAKSLSEPEWYAMVGIVGRCKDGEKLIHEFSKPYPHYNTIETKKKLQHALKDAGPATCMRIEEELSNGQYCQNCKYKGKVKSPITLGHPQKTKELNITTINKLSIDVRKKYFDGGRFCASLLSEEIIKQHNFFYDEQQLYIYQHGVYRPQGKQVIRKLCKELLGNEFRKNRVEEVIYDIETVSTVSTDVVNPADNLINVKNGLINWHTGELLPHTPKRISTIQIPVIYQPQAKCPQIENFLKEVLPEDCIPVIKELFGYILFPNTKFEKAFMFTGTGANGKSVMINLLTAFVGIENTTAIPFQELINSRWKRADLQGKLLNACADLSPRDADSSEVFKKIVSGDLIDAERKFLNTFYFRPFSKLVFSANAIPGAKDVSKAFYRRWVIIPFPNTFEHGKNADENLINRLTTEEELSGLLNIAIQGLKNLQTNCCFTETQMIKNALQEYQNNTDSVAAFTEENCLINESFTCFPQAVYDTYLTWCTKTGFRPLGRNSFYQQIKMLYPNIIDRKQSGSRRYWSGIGLLDDHV